MSNPRLKDLRGQNRRTFLRLFGVATAAFAIDRTRALNWLFDQGGEALAGPASCSLTNRSVHIIGGNGSFAWFQLLWPHIDVAQSNNSKVAYHSFDVPGTLHTPGGGNMPFYYAPEAPWMAGTTPTRPVTAFMSGANETHTQTPITPAIVSNNSTMLATVASIQRATPCLVPVIGVEPVSFGAALGAPSIATVPSALGMVELFNSAAAQLTLAAKEDQALYETYYKAIVSLRDAAGRPTWTRHLDIAKTATNLLGRNLSGILTPSQLDLDTYGVTALNASQAGAVAKSRLTNLGKALITTAKAFKFGLTNSVIIGLSPGATSEQTFVDPHVAFDNVGSLKATVGALGKILDAFYKDLDLTPDPACAGSKYSDTTILTVHGDTPHSPLEASAWPDATPKNSNWMYAMGGGHLRSGWFGGVHVNGSVDGFDPATGAAVPGKSSNETSTAAGAAVAYAVAKGDMTLVKPFSGDIDIKGIVV
ncbi:MAG: hypothetical protein ABI134_35495 [Byssovorax sp.]